MICLDQCVSGDMNESSGNDEQIITGQSRWNPTPEQMLVLQEVYSSGMRTPTTQQIQEIATKLQKYGRIEGKNVFYWFQNHKSRERLKRRRHNQQERFGFNNVHEEPLRKDEALGNRNSSGISVYVISLCKLAKKKKNLSLNHPIILVKHVY